MIHTWTNREFAFFTTEVPVLIQVSFGDLGRLQLDILQNVASYAENINIRQQCSATGKRRIAETMISASHFGSYEWKTRALYIAKQLMEETSSNLFEKWQMRYNSVARLYRGEPTAPSRFRLSVLADPESISVYGQALIEKSHALMRDGNLTAALDVISQFKTVEQPSELEKVTLAKVCLERGRILQCKGSWSDALSCFTALHGNAFLPLPAMCRLTCYISETWCELDRPDKALRYALDQMEDMDQVGWSKLNRAHGLLLSAGEAYLQQKNWLLAQKSFEQLLRLLDEKSELKTPDRIRRLRVHIGLARVFHAQDELDRAWCEWTRTELALKVCGWGIGFTHAIIQLSKSDICWQVGQKEKAAELRLQAETTLEGVSERSWLPCVDSKWVPWILSRLESRPIGARRT